MTENKYSAFPDIDFQSVWQSVKEENHLLDQENFFFYASGRSALYHGISCLPETERKKVLVPFYHCGVEVEAILRAGFEVEFYPLNDTLEIDFSWLEDNTSEDVGAVLVIHFFGFPQPMERISAFCKQKRIFLIEDCAHALYSSTTTNLLGTLGDIAIYSLMKTVGMPNGGGLLVNNEQCCLPRKGKPYFNMALIKKIVRSSLEFEARRSQESNGWAAKFLHNHDRKQTLTPQDNDQEVGNKLWYYEVPQYHYYHAMSIVSKYFLRPMAVSRIIDQRRRNYTVLMKEISWNQDMNPLFKQFDEGVCPLCLPVRVQHSDTWVEKLEQVKIVPFVFGRFAHSSFKEDLYPQVRDFQQGLMGLPIQQQLDEEDMKEIASRINILLDNEK